MLTVLEQKLAEAHGLAMSAWVVAGKVAGRIEDPSLLHELDRMREEAEETRVRCLLVERALPAFDELRAHASSTHETIKAMSDCVVENIVSWFDGKGAVTPAG